MIVIYDRHMFIVQATGRKLCLKSVNKINTALGKTESSGTIKNQFLHPIVVQLL
jgi:hypothetical protein